MINKKGFTLIELLAVIVILGILMLIAIPSVSKYIDSSRKKTYVTDAVQYVDSVKKDVVSGILPTPTVEQVLFVKLSSIKLEKGNNKSPYGSYIDDKSYVMVRNVDNNLKYYFSALDDEGYGIALTEDNKLSDITVTKGDELGPVYTIDEYNTNRTAAGSIRKNLFNGNTTKGFIDYNTGVIQNINSSYPNASYTDFIPLAANHTYQVYNFPGELRWRLYNPDGSYIFIGITSYEYKATKDLKTRILFFDELTDELRNMVKIVDLNETYEFIIV